MQTQGNIMEYKYFQIETINYTKLLFCIFQIFLAVMTSLFQGSWCLIGLIGIRHYSRVEHHVPQDLPKPTTAEHS